MSDQDFNSGYRGNQFHHGMDRTEYERGKSQKDLENTLPGNQKVEVPGVAYTLILVSPFLFTVYPVLGFTILAAIGATAAAMGLFPENTLSLSKPGQRRHCVSAGKLHVLRT